MTNYKPFDIEDENYPADPIHVAQLYEIWSEGFRTSGERGTAFFHGTSYGRNFKEACIAFFAQSKNAEYFNKKWLTFWACGLFDNENDARKRFG